MSQLEQSIIEVLDAYRAGVLAKDLDKFLALYDRDVRVFDTWGRWSYDGVDAWRERWRTGSARWPRSGWPSKWTTFRRSSATASLSRMRSSPTRACRLKARSSVPWTTG